MGRNCDSGKADLERQVAGRFCELLPDDATVVGPNVPPGADYTIRVQAERIHLELSGYREQGRYNETEERDEEFRFYIYDRWRCDGNVSEISVSLRYCENDRPQIPSVRKHPQEVDELISDLKALAETWGQDGARNHRPIRLVAAEKVAFHSRYDANRLYLAKDDFGSLAKYVDQVRFSQHADIPGGWPRTSLQVRPRAIDFNEIEKVIVGKINKLPQYREASDGKPVWLLFYAAGWPSSGRLRHDEPPEVIKCIRRLLERTDENFDAVWFGNDMLVTPGRPIVVRITPQGGTVKFDTQYPRLGELR